jgi:hypothetical protein
MDKEETNKFDEKIKSLRKGFFSALDDFKKYYVFYNKNPEVDEYQNFFANSKGQLQSYNSDIFLLTNQIKLKIKNLNDEMRVVGTKLKSEKEVNTELLKLINKIQATQDGSATMIDDAKDEYNIQYYKNWELIFLAFAFFSISMKLFTQPKINVSTA